MKYSGSILLSTVLLFTPLSAQPEVKCDVYAFVTDPASGVNVRSGPAKDFPIVAILPKDPTLTLVDVVGAKGDWLKIVRAGNGRHETVFSKTGWVFAPLLSIKVGGPEALSDGRLKVYSSPGKKSGTIPFSDFGIDLPLQGCQADWVKVKLPSTGTATSDVSVGGWMPLGAYCSNPWLECE